MKPLRRKGIALLAAVMLIVFATIAVTGVVMFVSQRLAQQPAEEEFVKAIYLAQAGAQYALYQFRATATPFSGTLSNIDGSGGYAVVESAGGTATSIVIDARASSLTNSNRDLSGVTISNNTPLPVTIDQITVTWTKANRLLTQIVINGVIVWSGSSTTPAVCSVNNFVIPANTTYPITRLRWNLAMNASTMTMSVRFTNGSTIGPCIVFPAQATTCGSAGALSVKSMGRISPTSVFRTIQAAYIVGTQIVASYMETNATVP